MAGNRQSSVRERHAHFADGDYLEREGNSEKAHEEDKLEFKKKQRRRSSVSKLPLGFASARRVSATSGDCKSLSLSLSLCGVCVCVCVCVFVSLSLYLPLSVCLGFSPCFFTSKAVVTTTIRLRFDACSKGY